MGNESQNISPETQTAVTEKIVDTLTNKPDAVVGNMNMERVDALINTLGKSNDYTPGNVDYRMTSFRTDRPNSTLQNIHAFEDITLNSTKDPAQEAGKNTEKSTENKNSSKEHFKKEPDGTYIIQPRDNLTQIAHGFNTTIKALAELNGIKHVNIIKAGAKLKIPETTQGQTSENKSAPTTPDAKSAQTPQKDPAKKEDHHKTKTPNIEHGTIAKPTEAKQTDMKPVDAQPIEKKDTVEAPEEIQRVKEMLSKHSPTITKIPGFTVNENAITCPNGTPIPVGGEIENITFNYDRTPDGKPAPNGKMYIICTEKQDFGGGEKIIAISNGKDWSGYPRGISLDGKFISPLQQDIANAANSPKNTEKKAW